MYLETAFLKIRTILQASTIVARIMDAILFSKTKMSISIYICLSKMLLYYNMICDKYSFKPFVEPDCNLMTAVCVCVWANLEHEISRSYSKAGWREQIHHRRASSFQKHNFVLLYQYIIFIPLNASSDMCFHTLYAVSRL
jgi:hypothetical protein